MGSVCPQKQLLGLVNGKLVEVGRESESGVWLGENKLVIDADCVNRLVRIPGDIFFSGTRSLLV